MSPTTERMTEHYAVNLAYCNCGERLIDDHVRRARRGETVVAPVSKTEAVLRKALHDVLEAGHGPYLGSGASYRPCRCVVHEDAFRLAP